MTWSLSVHHAMVEGSDREGRRVGLRDHLKGEGGRQAGTERDRQTDRDKTRQDKFFISEGSE